MSVNAIADHLWQSTWFAIGAWLLTLLVRRDARLTFWVWFCASVKFLIPFSLLTLLGRQLVWQVDEQALLPLVQHVAAPLTSTVIVVDGLSDVSARLLAAVWSLGVAVVLGRWFIEWSRIRTVVRASTPLLLDASVSVRCTNAIDVPGVVGIREPVLLIPTGLVSQLDATQLDCVIAHELCHVRRRDNLTAAMHSLVQALFWFHPLTWWIGARMIDAREHACDAGALDAGIEPRAYAATLLHVCRHSVDSRDLCVASATGGDLTARIRSIMSSRGPARFRIVKQALLGGILASCVALPVAAGIHVISRSEIHVPAGAKSIWPTRGGPSFFTEQAGFVYARNLSLRELISHTYAVDVHEVDGRFEWLDRPRYDLELRVPSNASKERLVAELLKQRFNLELVVRPTLHSKKATGLEF